MTVFYIILLVVAATILGLFVGFRLQSRTYNGVIKMVESEEGLVYTLELHGHPEDLVFQKDVRFKVIPPNYEDLQDLLRNEPEP